jgi:hypothetical protein
METYFMDLGLQQNIIKFRPNASMNPLSLTFVVDWSFKLSKYQIDLLSLEQIILLPC